MHSKAPRRPTWHVHSTVRPCLRTRNFSHCRRPPVRRVSSSTHCAILHNIEISVYYPTPLKSGVFRTSSETLLKAETQSSRGTAVVPAIARHLVHLTGEKRHRSFEKAFLPRDASAERGYEIAFVCPSVRLSVTIMYHDHTGWNSSKIISGPNSLMSMRSLTPNIGDLVQREHPQN